MEGTAPKYPHNDGKKKMLKCLRKSKTQNLICYLELMWQINYPDNYLILLCLSYKRSLPSLYKRHENNLF